MVFVEGAELVLTAIEFLEKITSGSEGAVQVTSDSVTYPKGLGASSAPYLDVPLLTICFPNPLNDDENFAEVPLVAKAHFGARGDFDPSIDPEQAKYEIANCMIGVEKIRTSYDVKPAMVVTATAQPTPVIDSTKQPALEWVVTLHCERASGERMLLAGLFDATFRVKVGSMGNVEFVDLDDHSDPPVAYDQHASPEMGIPVWLNWQVVPF